MRVFFTSYFYILLVALPVLLSVLQWRKKGMPILVLYYICYALTEVITYDILPPRTYNHFILATYMFIFSLLLPLYYAIHLQKRWVYILWGLFLGITGYIYITNTMWERQTVIHSKAVAAYYTIQAILAGIFIWQSTVSGKSDNEAKLIRIASLFLVYCIMYILVVSAQYGINTMTILEVQFTNIFAYIIYISFPIASSLILLKLLLRKHK